jgi:hypothetical protein
MLKIGHNIGLKKERIYFIFYFLIISNRILFAQTIECISPNSINKIYFENIASDDYIVYVDGIEKRSVVAFKARWEPKFIWYGDNVIEIKISDGPFRYSYIYVFNKNKLIGIDDVIEIFPEEEIIVYIESLSKINFRSFFSDKILQTIRIDGVTGVSLNLGGVRIKIDGLEILCISKVEPFTYKILEIPNIYIFKKEF